MGEGLTGEQGFPGRAWEERGDLELLNVPQGERGILTRGKGM